MKEGELRVHLVIILQSVHLRLRFSNAPILKGQVFSVKVSQECEGHVSLVIQKCTCKPSHSNALQRMPFLDSAHTRAVRAQEQLVNYGDVE